MRPHPLGRVRSAVELNQCFRIIFVPTMISNLRELLQQRVAERPNAIFLFSELDDRQWRYAEFDRAVNRVANMLKAHGIGKSDVVSLLMWNSAEYVIAYFACW